MRDRPDFFVVGAPKAATTSIYNYLAQHPALFVPSVKEPHYLSWPAVADTYYRTSFVTSEREYRALYANRSPGQLAGDFSTSYLFSATAAERISSEAPRSKIVIALRNPVDRALSHHRMDLRDGYTSEPLEALIAPSAVDARFRREYIDVGRYAAQVARYLARFPKSQIHVVLHDHLLLDTAAEIRSLLRFLGVDENQAIDVSQSRNATGTPRNLGAAKVVRSPVAARIASRLPQSMRAHAKKALMTSHGPPLSPTVCETLAREFEDELDTLEAMLDLDLTAWRF